MRLAESEKHRCQPSTHSYWFFDLRVPLDETIYFTHQVLFVTKKLTGKCFGPTRGIEYLPFHHELVPARMSDSESENGGTSAVELLRFEFKTKPPAPGVKTEQR